MRPGQYIRLPGFEAALSSLLLAERVLALPIPILVSGQYQTGGLIQGW